MPDTCRKPARLIVTLFTVALSIGIPSRQSVFCLWQE